MLGLIVNVDVFDCCSDPFSPEVKRVLQQQGTTATASNITPESESSSSKKFGSIVKDNYSNSKDIYMFILVFPQN